MSDADELAAELAKLSAEYRVTLATRLDALDALASALAGGQADAAGLKELRRALHTIAGSAKTFGLPAVSEAARAGEALLDPWCDAGRMPAPDDWTRLQAALAALHKAAEDG
jgi:HPt (histidine-containing phosphotransfer) domain-containing protein